MAAFFLTSTLAGPGFLIYIAMLGPTAAWLLPGHLALAMPFGLFGGALIAGAGPRTNDQPRDVVYLTCVLAILCLYAVGWLMPAGFRATGEATDRFQSKAASERVAPVTPASFEPPRLIAERSDPAVRAELIRRLHPPGACLFLGLLAAGLVASPFTWRASTAAIVTIALFLFQVRRWLEAWSGPA